MMINFVKWLKLVVQLLTANQSASFQHSLVKLNFNFSHDIGSLSTGQTPLHWIMDGNPSMVSLLKRLTSSRQQLTPTTHSS